jgi:hypothetical protein
MKFHYPMVPTRCGLTGFIRMCGRTIADFGRANTEMLLGHTLVNESPANMPTRWLAAPIAGGALCYNF